MKNKHIIFIIFFFIISFNSKTVLSNEFIFESNKIEIYDNGNLIKANDGIAKSIKNNFFISAKKFEYNKSSFILMAFNGIAKYPEKKVEIKANKFEYFEKKSLVKAYGEVVLNDFLNNITITSSEISYNIKSGALTSQEESIISDDSGNVFLSSNFIYKRPQKLVKITDATLTDKQKNIYKISRGFIDLKLEKLIGKDISLKFNNTQFNNENEPRLKGNAVYYNKSITTITKGIFTTCKANDDCPPWTISAEEIFHDKSKKTMNYKKAWLNVYDYPVFYFPKFFHPDPTVKRQSGFLMPSFVNSSNDGVSLNTPYFLAIAENSDATFSPRFYDKNKTLLQTEYRNVGKNFKNLIDASSVFDGSSITRSHFFSNSKGKIDIANFDESEITLNLQQVTNDRYLKSEKLSSPLIDNYSLLTSSVGISAYSEDLAFNADFLIYEDLNKKKGDRYEYVYPSYNLIKDLGSTNDLGVNGNLQMELSGYAKHYNTNVYENVLINDLLYNSNINFSNNGFKNKSTFLIKNVITDSSKSKNYKDKTDTTLKSIFEHNVSYPLRKLYNNNTNILEPKISFKFSPTNNRNLKELDRRIDVNNIYDLNRLGLGQTVEGGASLTYGLNYSKVNQNDQEILGARIANIFRLEEEKNLPQNSTLGDKTSDIVGDVKFRLNENLDMKYNFSLAENLNDINYQLIESEIKINNFVTKFEYLNENNTKNKETFISNSSSYIINDSKKIGFKTRKNKKTKLTEFYNLIYEYRNDCLIAALEFNKDYYSDRDIKPEKNIFFKLTIIPFGETSSPNLFN
jgi:LPS-assembly protein